MKSYSRVGRQVTEWDEAAYKKFVSEELTLIRFGNWKSVQDIFFKSEWIRDVLLFLLVILKVLDFE